MADDTNFRSYRPADPHGRPAAPAAGGRPAGSDPLAELARLIGQTDPFADMSHDSSRGSARPTAATSESQPGHPFDPPSFESQPYVENRQGGFQPAYDPAIYGSPPPAAGSYGSQPYYDDPTRMPQADEVYDDDFGEERPRRGMKTVMVLVGLAILGTSAAFGYRAIFGSGGSAAPPVIKANTAPSKVPGPAGDASNKLIYDRVGDAAQGEKVVSREEQPVEVRPPPRVVFPGLPASPDRQGPSTAMASPPLGDMPAGPSSAEPKKIRTVTIRPDQPLSTAAPASAATPRTATPPAAARPITAPAVAPPPPVPATQSNAPLSLSPQGVAAEASSRPAPPSSLAPAPPTRVASVSSAAEAGSYTVQISSQRSEAEAMTSFRSLQAKFPSVLGDRQPIVRRADLGDKGIYYRAMVGPFASVDQATQFCGSLKSAGGQCVVQRN
jgi:hypothetical protein